MSRKLSLRHLIFFIVFAATVVVVTFCLSCCCFSYCCCCCNCTAPCTRCMSASYYTLTHTCKYAAPCLLFVCQRNRQLCRSLTVCIFRHFPAAVVVVVVVIAAAAALLWYLSVRLHYLPPAYPHHRSISMHDLQSPPSTSLSAF